MKKNIRSLVFLFLIPFLFLGINCTKEVTKDNSDPKLAQPNKVPPGHAEISGEIVEIEPVSATAGNDDPCSKAPCVAKVKIESATYGSGFPTLSKKENLRVKFYFTLSPTTKDLFPNMEESYPGLKVGDKFTALTGFVSSIGQDQPEYFVYGYSKK